ncbi:MFS transporter [Massilia sp. PAMC28688]|uniref:MFS transporter n=1 Tax=Massilia sp. PAMC28688 TaxID=2861283 RepID=UPI001C628CF2|nr:MFS transporter [Massilia sp. PAMC28688]QYF94581.1 MFS transporter [Massilia sp. PAMC28688]
MHFPLRGAPAIRVFLSFALGYFLSYALRSINAVIAPALVAELGLSNADLGLLSSAYFVAFGCMQLPLGVWLDKYGARRTEAALLLCAAVGAVLFATGTTLAWLWIGRALIGIGVSACLMASLKAYRQWFALEQQSQLAIWMLVAGTSGAMAATVPVSLTLPLIGWRGVFWVVAALLALASAVIFFVLRDVERGGQQQATAAPHEQGYAIIFRSPYFWRLGLLGLVNHGIFSALQTLWAGPWLMTVLGKSQVESGEILFVFNFVMLLAYLGAGWMAPRLVRRGINMHKVIGAGMAGMIVMQACMVATSAPASWLLWLGLGLFVPVVMLVQSYAGLAFPPALAGRANSAYNLQLFLGAFAAQWGFGVAVDAFRSSGLGPADAFRMTLAVAIALQVATLLFFALSRALPQKTA